MKKPFLLGCLIFYFPCLILAQSSCLEDGISFTTQASVDNFSTNYPGCTEIEGTLTISGQDITNLNGLGVITRCRNHVFIEYNENLTNLAGLISLATIDGYLYIQHNYSLINFEGLSSLKTIGGSLKVDFNPVLENFVGMDSLVYIGQHLEVTRNAALLDFTGLNLLKQIGNGLTVNTNDNLINFNGLGNLVQVGDIEVRMNNLLTNFEGFDSLGKINGKLTAYANFHLLSMDGLESLDTVMGSLEIYNNEIMESLSGLENLEYVGWNVVLQLPRPVNFQGLNKLHKIGGALGIQYMNGLADLSGLDNLDTVLHDVSITSNSQIASLNGLGSLSYIGGNLEIGFNDSLTTVSALNNLNSLHGYLLIRYNRSLASLDGLQNINANYMNDLTIDMNYELTECDVKSICDYLGLGGLSSISDNKTGCNSVLEVLTACEPGAVEDIPDDPVARPMPNPTRGVVQFTLPANQADQMTLRLYDLQGRQILAVAGESSATGEQIVQFNLSPLHDGLYFYRLNNPSGQVSCTGKLMFSHQPR